jgi:DNA-binding protein WhiA
MSFSTEVKEELSKLSNLANKACVKAELFGYLNANNVSIKQNEIKFSTESEYNINRFGKLLSNLNIVKYDINIVGKNFSIHIPKASMALLEEALKDYKVPEVENEQKAFVRGIFLGGGTINNPKNKYHIEMIVKKEKTATDIVNILNKYDIKFKILNKTNAKSKAAEKYLVYSKDGEEISKILAFIGASTAVLKFEEIRVYRDMKNNINRIVNCETANLTKTVDASVKQIEAIKKLKQEGKFGTLPDNLKEIAELRIKNPEASLAELGKMLKEPIGKSGVNYRLQTIIKMSL